MKTFKVLRRSAGILFLLIIIAIFPIIQITSSYLKSELNDDNFSYIGTYPSFISRNEKYIYQFGHYQTKSTNDSSSYINKYDLNGKLVAHKIIEDENQKYILDMNLIEGDDCLFVYFDELDGTTSRYVYTLDTNLNIKNIRKTEEFFTFKNYGNEILAISNSVLNKEINLYRMDSDNETELLFTLPWGNYVKNTNRDNVHINMLIHKVTADKIYVTFSIFEEQIFTAITECFDYSGNTLWSYKRVGCEFNSLNIINNIIYVGGTDINYDKANESYIAVPVVCSFESDGRLRGENNFDSNGLNATISRIIGTKESLVIIGSNYSTPYYKYDSNTKKYDIRQITELNGLKAEVFINNKNFNNYYNNSMDLLYINDKFIIPVDIETKTIITTGDYPVIKTFNGYKNYLNTLNLIDLVNYIYIHKVKIIIFFILLALVLNYDIIKRKPKYIDDHEINQPS